MELMLVYLVAIFSGIFLWILLAHLIANFIYSLKETPSQRLERYETEGKDK